MTKQLPQYKQERICKICGGLGEVENPKAMHAKDQFTKCRGCSKEQEEPKQIEKLELTKDDDYWECTHYKLNEIIDTVNSLLSKTKDD